MTQHSLKSFIVNVALSKLAIAAFIWSLLKHIGAVCVFVTGVMVIRYLRRAEIGWTYDLLGGIFGITAIWIVNVAKTFAAAYREFCQ